MHSQIQNILFELHNLKYLDIAGLSFFKLTIVKC